MGIRGLTTLIKKHAPNAINVYRFNCFKNAVIAVDTSILLYKFRYLSHQNIVGITFLAELKLVCYRFIWRVTVKI